MHWVMHKGAQPADGFAKRCGEFVERLHRAVEPVFKEHGLVTVAGGGDTKGAAFVYRLRATAESNFLRARLYLNIHMELREQRDGSVSASVDFGVYIPPLAIDGAYIAPQPYSAQQSTRVTARQNWCDALLEGIVRELRAFLEKHTYIKVIMFVAGEETRLVRKAILEGVHQFFIPQFVEAAAAANLVLSSVYPSLVCHTQHLRGERRITYYYCTVYGKFARAAHPNKIYSFRFLCVIATTILLSNYEEGNPTARVHMSISEMVLETSAADNGEQTEKAERAKEFRLPHANKVILVTTELDEQSLTTTLRESARRILQLAAHTLAIIINEMAQSAHNLQGVM